MSLFLWCYSHIHFSSSRTSVGHNQGSVWKRQYSKGKNSITGERHNSTIGILPLKHLLFFPGSILWTGGMCGFGVPGKPHNSQPLYGVLWGKSCKHYHPPPSMWLMYVEDTFVVQKKDHKHNFLEHINRVDSSIRFTVEDNKENDAIPFLDTSVKPEADSRLSITVYRKPTHMDQYLEWDSHHHLSVKYSIINTLTHRAKTVCNKPELLQKEMEHLR